MKLRTAVILVLTLLLITLYLEKCRGCEFAVWVADGKILEVRRDNIKYGTGYSLPNIYILKSIDFKRDDGLKYQEKYIFNVIKLSKTNLKTLKQKGILTIKKSVLIKCFQKQK